MADAKRNGRLRPRIGSEDGNAKLTEDGVRTLLELRRQGLTQVEAAAALKVSQATVSAIENGIEWCHVTGLERKQPYSRRKLKT